MLDGSPHEEYSSKKLLPKSLNILDYRVEELAIAYGLKYVHNFGEGITAVNAAAIGSVSFKKVILSSSSSCVDEIDDGFVIMATKRAIANCWFGEKKMVGDTFNLKIRALQILPIIMKDSMP